ncbi:hypothetical protein V6N13_122481 [Hibiscus sabdariffa]|uniref:Uncharacterized protein n=1 Tax=Hibiscus sabdariffa TaxID=183260 RepID=A0ABR2Q776_9ROSI
MLEETLAINYRHREGVTVVRDFHPFFGRNAPLLSEEERAKWLTSLKNKGCNIEKLLNKEPLEETLCTDVRQVIEDVQDIHALDGKVEDSSPRLSVEGIQSKPDGPASEKMLKLGAYEAYSSNDMEEDVENMSKINIKPSEAFPNKFDNNFKKSY